MSDELRVTSDEWRGETQGKNGQLDSYQESPIAESSANESRTPDTRNLMEINKAEIRHS